MDHETRVFQAADGKNLAILACTVIDWSTRVMDRQTDRQTDESTNTYDDIIHYTAAANQNCNG